MASFRVLFIAAILIVAVISASMNVAAAEKVAKVNRVSALKNSGAIVVVSLEAQQKLTDSKLTVAVPELGLQAKHNVDFSKSKKKTIHLELSLPHMLDPYVKVVFSSDEGKRVKYRPLIFG